jgi:hypothetical protein
VIPEAHQDILRVIAKLPPEDIEAAYTRRILLDANSD